MWLAEAEQGGDRDLLAATGDDGIHRAREHAPASGGSVEAGVGRSAMRGEYGIRAQTSGGRATILVPMADLQRDASRDR